MSESGSPTSPRIAAHDDRRVAVPPSSGAWQVGETLAARREAMGLTVDAAATRLKRQPRQIAAIEAGEFASLPQGSNLRGLVRSYARLLEIDPEPLLVGLPNEVPGWSNLNLAAEVSRPSHVNRRRSTRRSLPIGAWLLLAAIVVAVVAFAVEGDKISAMVHSSVEGWRSDKSSSEGSAAVNPPLNPIESPSPTTAASPSDASSQGTSAASAAGAAPQTSAVNVAPATSPAVAPTPALRVMFNKESWFRLITREGTVVAEGSSGAGTTRDFEIAGPSILTLGNATAVRVELRGAPVDLSRGMLKGDVARIELQ